MYENPTLCSACGGKCCKAMAGSMLPEDVIRAFPSDSLHSSLVAAFRSGLYVVDWWEGDPRPDKSWEDEDALDTAEYVRPRQLDDGTRLWHGSWGGQCGFWTPTGCQLEHDDRPYSCRMLEPKEGANCHMHTGGGKGEVAIAWIPHHATLRAALDEAEKWTE